MRRLSRFAVALVIVALLVPATAFADIKRLNPDGSIPARWNLPKPPPTKAPDVQPVSAGGSGNGENKITFEFFEDGDMCVVLGKDLGHAGEWDSAFKGKNLEKDRPFWSANTTPSKNVLREPATKYNAYDRAYGLWVPSLSKAKRAAARNYCRAQEGEPYDITSSKSNQSRWYCSKLVWASYKYTANLDLDADGGLWVTPQNVIDDSDAKAFAIAK